MARDRQVGPKGRHSSAASYKTRPVGARRRVRTRWIPGRCPGLQEDRPGGPITTSTPIANSDDITVYDTVTVSGANIVSDAYAGGHIDVVTISNANAGVVADLSANDGAITISHIRPEGPVLR